MPTDLRLPARSGTARPGRALQVLVLLFAVVVAGLLSWQAKRGWDMTSTLSSAEAATRADGDYRIWLCLEAAFRERVPGDASIWISDDQPNLYYQRIAEMSVLGHRVTVREDAELAVRLVGAPGGEGGCAGLRLDVAEL